jgi:hypothetical protein
MNIGTGIKRLVSVRAGTTNNDLANFLYQKVDSSACKFKARFHEKVIGNTGFNVKAKSTTGFSQYFCLREKAVCQKMFQILQFLSMPLVLHPVFYEDSLYK